VHATGHEAFWSAADHIPGLPLPGSWLDGRVVELVPANVGAPLGERRIR
jgi:hypothetical protein